MSAERSTAIFKDATVKKETEQDGQIGRLCSVVQISGRRSNLVYIGWTNDSDSRPIVVTDEKRLSEEALKSIDSFRKSRLPIKSVDFSALTAVEFSLTGEPVDFKDTERHKAEDLVCYSVRTSEGQQSISLGELAVLKAIVEARQDPWQDMGFSRFTESVTAKTMYTIFVPTNENPYNSGMAIIFRPSIEGESNEIAFQLFVRQTLGKLLLLDEMQQPEKRKGYIAEAARISGVESEGLLSDMLLALGVVEYDKQGPNSSQLARRRIRTRLASLFFENVDPTGKIISDPGDYYDIENLDLQVLFNLAEKMLLVAENYLER